MSDQTPPTDSWEVERYELRAAPVYSFAANRREFVQTIGASLAVVVTVQSAEAQRDGRRGRGGGGDVKLSQRFQLDADGTVTVFTSKVEVGQGSRTQITQAAAEELRMPLDKIRIVMADTERCPDDGGTAGSRTTPATVPSVRRAASALRKYLDTKKLTVAALAKQEVLPDQLSDELVLAEALALAEITPVTDWHVLGKSAAKVDAVAVVTGKHQYPSDIQREGMLYGKVLSEPSFDAKLISIDLTPAEKMEGVTIVRDGDFIGCTAATSWAANKAVEAIAATAKWEEKAQISSEQLFEHFKETARKSGAGRDRPQIKWWGPLKENIAMQRTWQFEGSYTVPYIQHAPMEPRAAVAEWNEGKLTVWTGTQQPGRVLGELKQVFRLNDDQVRVIVPDTGGGFGGKHSGEAAIEAARLAKAAGKPVSLRWTREEEFTWAYFRPAGLIEVKAQQTSGVINVWAFSNYNSGGSALSTPYLVTNGLERFYPTDSPLRQGSYRALASTANTFARECAMDELAEMADMGPLEFRLKNMSDGRLKDVLVAATEKFKWPKGRSTSRDDKRGIGLACGTEKGSFVAACVEVEVVDKRIRVLSVTQAFECGAIQNPANLRSQVEGCIVMGLGGALTEEIKFRDGKITNASFSSYTVPRMADVPEMEIVLLNRTDIPSVGAGETPIIAIAPAIANAVFDATGQRLRSLPLRIN
jgi:CO/xanthine dehydrogenase Mo-binding subunit